MATAKKSYIVNSLPASPEASSIYYVKSGGGFDVVVTDNSGNPKYLYREPKQKEISGIPTIKAEDINSTLFANGAIQFISIDPTNEPLRNNFECFINNNSGGDFTITMTAATGWSYIVNNASSVSSGNITMLATGQCAILRETSNKVIYILGDVQ